MENFRKNKVLAKKSQDYNTNVVNDFLSIANAEHMRLHPRTWRMIIQSVILEMHDNFLSQAAEYSENGEIECMIVYHDAAYGLKEITKGIEVAQKVNRFGNKLIEWQLRQQTIENFLNPYNFELARKLYDDPTRVTLVYDAVEQLEATARGNPPEHSIYTIPDYLNSDCVMAGARFGQAVFIALTSINQEIPSN